MEGIAFLRVLKIPAFRNLWLSQAISQIFLNLLMFSLILRVYELTHSSIAVSLVVITTVLPNITIGALAGVLVDRWNRKIVMFFSHFLRVLAVATFIISSESLLWIYLMTIVIGVITQFFMPAEASTIPEAVKDKNILLTANSLFTLTFFSSVVIGNVLAGPFLQFFGAHLTFAIVAGAFLVASFFTAKLPRTSIARATRNHSLRENLVEGLSHIRHTRTVRQAIFIMAVGQGMIAILGTIAPGFADKILHLPVADVSVFIMAPAAFGMIVGAIAAGQFFAKAPRENLIRVGFLGAALILLLFSQVDLISRITLVPLVPLAVLILIALGMSNAFLEVPINTLIQENTPLAVRSRVYGVISSVVGVAAIIPTFLAGALADTIGVRYVMFFAVFILLATAVYATHHS